MLSGNHALQNYLNRIWAKNALAGPSSAEFDFVDLRELSPYLQCDLGFVDGRKPFDD